MKFRNFGFGVGILVLIFAMTLFSQVSDADACRGNDVEPTVDSTWLKYTDPNTGMYLYYPSEWRMDESSYDLYPNDGIPGVTTVTFSCWECKAAATYQNCGDIPEKDKAATPDQIYSVEFKRVTELKNTGCSDRVFIVEAGANMALCVLPKDALWIPRVGKNPGWLFPSISMNFGVCSLSSDDKWPFMYKAIDQDKLKDVQIVRAILSSVRFAPDAATITPATPVSKAGLSLQVDSTWKTYYDADSGAIIRYPADYKVYNESYDRDLKDVIPGTIDVTFFSSDGSACVTYRNHAPLPEMNKLATSDQFAFINYSAVTELKNTGLLNKRVFMVEAGITKSLLCVPKNSKWVPKAGKNPAWFPSISTASGVSTLSTDYNAYAKWPLVASPPKEGEAKHDQEIRAIMSSITFSTAKPAKVDLTNEDLFF